MPLLTSPIDGSPMRQINRYGIEIDVCPSSGGIWLDRGELEKLMTLLKEESSYDPLPMPPRKRDERLGRYDDDDDDDRRGYGGYRGGYKKKGKMSKIMDIFDF